MTTRRDVNRIILASCLIAGCPKLSRAAESGQKKLLDTGLLDKPTQAVLTATAEAVTQTQDLRGHYEAYYQHQAQYRAGHLTLYRQYAALANRFALLRHRDRFTSCDFSTRIEMIATMRELPDIARGFEVPIFQETLAIFERTDAWLQLGYESWPGTARGHDEYKTSFR